MRFSWWRYHTKLTLPSVLNVAYALSLRKDKPEYKHSILSVASTFSKKDHKWWALRHLKQTSPVGHTGLARGRIQMAGLINYQLVGDGRRSLLSGRADASTGHAAEGGVNALRVILAMAILEGLVAPEVDAHAADDLAVMVVAETTVNIERNATDGRLILEADDVNVLADAVLPLRGDHEIVHGIHRGENTGGDEVALGVNAGRKGGEHAGVVVVITDETTNGELVEVELTFETDEHVIEVRAVQTAKGQAEQPFGWITGEKVATVAEDVGAKATGEETVQLKTETLTDRKRDRAGGAAQVIVIHGTVEAVELAVDGRDRRFIRRSGDAWSRRAGKGGARSENESSEGAHEGRGVDILKHRM